MKDDLLALSFGVVASAILVLVLLFGTIGCPAPPEPAITATLYEADGTVISEGNELPLFPNDVWTPGGGEAKLVAYSPTDQATAEYATTIPGLENVRVPIQVFSDKKTELSEKTFENTDLWLALVGVGLGLGVSSGAWPTIQTGNAGFTVFVPMGPKVISALVTVPTNRGVVKFVFLGTASQEPPNPLSVQIISPIQGREYEEGEMIDFETEVYGGSPPYSWLWKVGDYEYDDESFSTSFTGLGEVEVSVKVTDSVGNVVSSDMVKFEIVESGTVPLEAKITSPEHDKTVVVDQYGKTQFTGQASGGTPPYTWLWVLPDGTTDNRQSFRGLVQAVPGQTVQRTVSLTVTDSKGKKNVTTSTFYAKQQGDDVADVEILSPSDGVVLALGSTVKMRVKINGPAREVDVVLVSPQGDVVRKKVVPPITIEHNFHLTIPGSGLFSARAEIDSTVVEKTVSILIQ